jgi:hypothetical protein
MVIAPDHPLTRGLATPERRAEVFAYAEATSRRSDMERTAVSRERTGVFTGALAIHPLTGQTIPIYTADYVLGAYGTGAIMAVPAVLAHRALDARRGVRPEETGHAQPGRIHFQIRGLNGVMAFDDREHCELLGDGRARFVIWLFPGSYHGRLEDHGKQGDWDGRLAEQDFEVLAAPQPVRVTIR